MRRLLVLCFFLAGCSAGVKDWADTYKYQAKAGWSLEEEKRKVLPQQPASQEPRENLYNKEVQEKLTKLLRETPTPLRVPDTIVRVLVLPYVDEKGNLNAQKYIFFRAEEGRWILGEYLLQKGKAIRELKPLEGDLQ
ncbi:MAG: TraV family lipoprotein [Aquificaceae bacterium]